MDVPEQEQEPAQDGKAAADAAMEQAWDLIHQANVLAGTTGPGLFE